MHLDDKIENEFARQGNCSTTRRLLRMGKRRHGFSALEDQR